jgi:putative membrane protein
MFRARLDSVSNIHRRWSFTRLNPSSYKISYIVSLSCGAAIVLIQQGYGAKEDQLNFLWSLLLGIIFLTAANFIDFFALRGCPLNKISKVLHVSAFANLLWFLTVLAGAASDTLFSKNGSSINYVIEGMSLAIGLRIGIFTSVFGARLPRAIAVSVIQPLIFLFAFENSVFFSRSVLLYPVGLGFGLCLIAIGIVWTIVADRAGRPRVESTFRLLQAFLAAWTENKTDNMEQIAEAKAHDELVSTYVIKFKALNCKQVSIVLPQVHPGPFNPIGGSDLPYTLYTVFSKTALVLHSVSDHSFNIPSKKELEKYIATLSKQRTLEVGNTCSIPVEVRIGESSVTGIAFGKIVIAILSMAPKGMEDVPEVVGKEIQKYALQLGIKHILLVDSHNAMGDVLRAYESNNLVIAAKQCLERLKHAEQYQFKIGFANSADIYPKLFAVGDLGRAGLAVIVIEVGEKRYLLGWADSNNMENGLREVIIKELNNKGIRMIEVCTSDTHSTSGKRTRQGYYSLGNITAHSKIAQVFFEISNNSIKSTQKSNFELLLTESKIKVMGKDQFDDYSSALDKSMNITKIFLLMTITIFVSMLILS